MKKSGFVFLAVGIVFLGYLVGHSENKNVIAAKSLFETNMSTFRFMSENGYNGSDITKINFTETVDKDKTVLTRQYNLKDDIKVKTVLTLSRDLDMVTSIKSKKSDNIDDILNCMAFEFSDMYSSNADKLASIVDRNTFSSKIKEALENESDEIEIFKTDDCYRYAIYEDGEIQVYSKSKMK